MEAKRLMKRGQAAALTETINLEAEVFAARLRSPEFRQGDKLLAIGGKSIDSWNEFDDQIGCMSDMLAAAATPADSLKARSHADYDESLDLKAMIRANLVAERIAVEVYRQLIALIGDKDPSTTHLLRAILADEEEHADDLSDWLDKS